MKTERGWREMLCVVTGGSGSGKSEFAEKWLVVHDDTGGARYYIATMKPFGKEAEKRIARHRRQRQGRGFTTIEQYLNLEKVPVEPGASVLLECMSNLVANEMFEDDGSHDKLVTAIEAGINHLLARAKHVVVVTNEVFSDGEAYDASSMQYLAYLGEVSRMLAKKADLVVEVVYSIPVILKGTEDVWTLS